MMAIFKRDFRSYFNTMTGYIYVACVVVFTGIYFMAYNLAMGYPYFSMVLSALPLIYCIAVPILTMRSFAEERKTKTDQMLLTAPVSVSEIVIGKFFSVMSVVAIPIIISCICPVIIAVNGASHLGVDYASMLAFYVMCGMFVSLGLFISSLTENQIISAVLTFGLLLILYLWDNLVDFIPTTSQANLAGVIVVVAIIALLIYNSSKNMLITMAVSVVLVGATVITYLVNDTLFEGLLQTVLGSFSCVSVLSNFASYSVFDIGGLFLFISLTALFLFLTGQTIQKRRWS